MTSSLVKGFSSAWWAEVCHRIIGAAVFMDESVAECLHWQGGVFDLMLAGAKFATVFNSLDQGCPDRCKKIVFITKAKESDLKIIEKILTCSSTTHCILISAVSLEVVYMEMVKDHALCEMAASGQAGQKPAEYLTEKLQTWMSHGQKPENVNAQAIHIPTFTIPLTDVVFVTPPFDRILPSNNGHFIKDPLPDLQYMHEDDRENVRRLASALNSMMDSMNFKEDVYYVGNYSSLVAGVLENSPIYINRRKNSLQPASLIIIDRTLDLCGVASHSSESVYDKMRSMLPHYPGHLHECAVDMSPVCRSNSFKFPHDVHMSPGSLYEPGDETTIRTLDHMINKSQKEVMVEVYDRLLKMIDDKTMSPKLENLTKVTPQSLEKVILSCTGNYEKIKKNLGAITHGLALVQMHKSPLRAPRDLLMNLEKQMIQSLATSRESTSVLTQIAQLIKTRNKCGILLDNLIALLIHVYSLTGSEFPFSATHQTEIVDALTKALVETSFDSGQTKTVAVAQGKELSERIMVHLNEIKYMRKNISKYNSLLKPCESGDGFEYKGLLQQLVEDLVNTARPDMPDLQHRSEGLKDLLRTGLSMLSLTGKKTKHPLDNQTVVIFIIGGTNAEECKRVHRTVITSGVDNTVLIGSTRFLSPEETTHFYMDPSISLLSM